MVLQLAPLVLVVVVSFSASPVFDLPVDGLSLRWYRRLLHVKGFWASMALSAQIASLSTAAALVLGTAGAVAVHRCRFPGRRALVAAILSPLMLPGLVLGIAMLQGYRRYGLDDAFVALLVAHVVLTTPFIMRVVLASLSLFNFEMIDAARSLGYSHVEALVRVLPPNLYPAFLSGVIFAFLASFDNYPISIFLTDARNKTLPIQMIEFIDESADPTLAAVSTLLVVMAALALLVTDRLLGLRRLVSL
ncbi:MAG TPA: ABC transporter permease [Methylomirabilota bacterium]|jgi:putative spermidine/putrescine transport system permease protein|nr:ABC transporter permease [Methylomirabilota bacterium]